MKIGIIGSMQFTDKMIGYCDLLKEMGHDSFMTDLHTEMIGKSEDEIEVIKLRQKKKLDPIKEFWDKMQNADAVLVLNFNKHGVANYIGANTLMEIGFAHVLGQRIFLLNPIPDMPYCKSEIESVNPIVIHGDISRIKERDN